jgi:UDP-2,4-diacetamido-2,4,6-trideoxy-beta-L-altropyranose hydrolase
VNIFFRVDASLEIGTGHVMRCLTLAESLRIDQVKCYFICREHSGHLISEIRERGFHVAVLPQKDKPFILTDNDINSIPAHAHWLGTDWETDAKETIKSFEGQKIDCLIVDHYALDVFWERTLRSHCDRIMVIDDLEDRLHYCDILLDQSLGCVAQSYAQLVPSFCEILAGPNFALLRPEFALWRDSSLERRKNTEINHLLVSMGGVDKFDATSKVLTVMEGNPLTKNMHITVVMGPYAPHLNQVKKIATSMAPMVDIKINVNNMAELMMHSDIAIGAAGTTSWERCCLGLPCLIVILAENQRSIATELEKHGCGKVIGDVGDILIHLNTALKDIMTDMNFSQWVKNCASITNGTGTDKIKSVLTKNYG